MEKLRRASILFVVFLVAGCSSEPSEPTDPGFPRTASGEREGVELQNSPHRALNAVPQLEIDLPLEPRPWDSDPEALASAVAEAHGNVMIGLKPLAKRRALENDGIRPALSREEFQAGLDLLHAFGVKVKRVFNSFGAVAAKIEPADAPTIQGQGLVDYVEPESYAVLSGKRFAADGSVSTPNLFSQTTPWGVSVVRAQPAWQKETGSGATVMIIDTGHDQGHEDLPSVSSGDCYGTYGGCSDANGHGTHVLGDLMARNNSLGSLGVAPGVSGSNVISWAACDSVGECLRSEIATALDSAASWEIDVVNLSIQGPYHTGVANAVSLASSADVFMVASAGNDTGSTVQYPAGYFSVMGVSGVKSDSSFASTSPCSSASGYGVHVDLAAPFWSYNAEPGDTYADEDEGYCGNSFSTPHVAGAAALIRAEKPNLPRSYVWNRLIDTAEELGSSGWDSYFGEGLLDVKGALGPFADIDGLASVQPNQTCEWSAMQTGGNGPFSYQWRRNSTPVGTDRFYSYEVGTTGFELRLTVTDSDGWADTKVLWVTVSAQGSECAAEENP